jgi:hypothetical protein
MNTVSVTTFFLLCFLPSALASAGECADFAGDPDPSEYVVVLDAGSSKTEAFIYRLTSQDSMTHPPRVDRCDVSYRTEQGISSLLSNQTTMDTYLENILEDTKKYLENMGFSSTQLQSVPIYLRATAGVRISPVEAQEPLMELATETLQRSGFSPTSDAQVISGFAEGVYAWLSLNIKENKIGGPWDETFGIIEMGGASEQITFIPASQPNTFPMRISGNSYSLYSYSYNHFGSDEAKLVTEILGCNENSTITRDYATCKNSWTEKLNEDFACKPLCGLVGVDQPPIPEGMNFTMLGGTPLGISDRCSLNGLFQATFIDEIGNGVCSGDTSKCLEDNYGTTQDDYCKRLALLSAELAGNDDEDVEFDGFGFAKDSTQVRLPSSSSHWTEGFVIANSIGIVPDNGPFDTEPAPQCEYSLDNVVAAGGAGTGLGATLGA